MHRVLPLPERLPRHPRPSGEQANFFGPRFFVRLAELEMHPLDTADRRQLMREAAGVGYCNITKCCTEVCPEDIHITDNAIIPLKERVADVYFDPVRWAIDKVRGASSELASAQLSGHSLSRAREGGGQTTASAPRFSALSRRNDDSSRTNSPGVSELGDIGPSGPSNLSCGVMPSICPARHWPAFPSNDCKQVREWPHVDARQRPPRLVLHPRLISIAHLIAVLIDHERDARALGALVDRDGCAPRAGA